MKKTILAIAVAIAFTSCTTYKCYPSKGSRDYAHTHIKKVKEGYLVTMLTRNSSQQYLYECLPDSLQKLTESK